MMPFPYDNEEDEIAHMRPISVNAMNLRPHWIEFILLGAAIWFVLWVCFIR